MAGEALAQGLGFKGLAREVEERKRAERQVGGPSPGSRM